MAQFLTATDTPGRERPETRRPAGAGAQSVPMMGCNAMRDASKPVSNFYHAKPLKHDPAKPLNPFDRISPLRRRPDLTPSRSVPSTLSKPKTGSDPVDRI